MENKSDASFAFTFSCTYNKIEMGRINGLIFLIFKYISYLRRTQQCWQLETNSESWSGFGRKKKLLYLQNSCANREENSFDEVFSKSRHVNINGTSTRIAMAHIYCQPSPKACPTCSSVANGVLHVEIYSHACRTDAI